MILPPATFEEYAYLSPWSSPHGKRELYLEIQSYDLRLDVDFTKSLVKGTVEIRVNSAEDPLRLDAAEIRVESVRTNGVESKFAFDEAKQTLTIPHISKRESVVTVSFRKQVSDEVTFGLYKSKYEKDHFLVTDLFPAQARTIFPCKDDPSYKAVFKLSVTTEEGLQVISNTQIRTQVHTKDGRVMFKFEPSPRMSTYLFFMGIGKFEEASTQSNKTRIIVASKPGQSGNGRFILGIASGVLKEYVRYFGIPYPLKKLHLVALPEYQAGAMENWGAITSRESGVLITEDSSADDRQRAAHTMAHEIAHQWFGDLVTMKWFDDLWLNESFATFMDCKMMDTLHPEWKVWSDFLRDDTFSSLNADALSTTHPIQVPVRSMEEVKSILDAVSYGKGASVLRMLNSYIGEEAFRKGVSSYLRAFRFSNAIGEDFWNALGRSSGLPVTRVAKAWITRPGFPVVEVRSSSRGVRLTQRRFQLGGKVKFGTWPIPLDLQVDGRDRTMLLERKTALVRAANPHEVIVNRRRTGFYSVFYDDPTYANIAGRFAMLDGLDRAGIINDLYLFLQAGKIKPERYFQFVSAASKLRDPLVTELIAHHLADLRAIADEARVVSDAYPQFYPSQIRKYGLTPKKGEDESIGKLRERLVPGLVRTNPEYARRLARLFNDFGSVEPSLKSAVAIAYAMSNGESAYEPLVSLIKEARIESERRRIYAALTSFEDPGLVERTLELSISGEVSRSDSVFTLSGAALNPRARVTLWKWLTKRYGRLRDIYAGSPIFMHVLDRIIPLCGVELEVEVRKFISGKRYKEGGTTFKRTFELLDIHSRLRKRLLSA
jgi:tricorn protease interacting factor F2/3